MTSTGLKLVALGLMLFDHIYTFIDEMPIWLTWLGRLAAPLFIFGMVWGLKYTHNRNKYLWNMYLWNVGMAIGNVIVSYFIHNAKAPLKNNIFTTILLIGIIVTIIESFLNNNKECAKQLLFLLLGAQVLSILLVPLSSVLLPDSYNVYLLPSSVFPSLLFCEGGFLWVIFGVILYFIKQNKRMLSVTMITFSLICLLLGGINLTYKNLFLQNYQWMMVAALPLMLCYNGKRGYGLKWLFYLFYPIHIFLLYWIGSF